MWLSLVRATALPGSFIFSFASRVFKAAAGKKQQKLKIHFNFYYANLDKWLRRLCRAANLRNGDTREREREKVKVEGQTGDTGSWGTHPSGLAEAGTGAEAAAGAVAGAGAVAVVEAGAKALAQTALFRMHA